MLGIIATVCGIIFGMVAMSLSLRNHIRQIKQDFERRLAEEMSRQSEAKVKAYAAQRDFEHLDRHQEQLKLAVAELQDDFTEMEKKLLEMQIIGKGAYNRIEQVAARLDANGITMGGSHRPPQ
jgi:chromosome segregation ATPase